MTMLPIRRSSHLAAAGHEGSTLEVHFQNGDRYRYGNVSEKEYRALMMAPSPGTFLHNHIRKWHKGVKIER